MSDPTGTKRDPLLGAALVRISLERQGTSLKSGFYLDILDDLGLTDDEVVRYVEGHRDELLARLAVRDDG